MPHVLLDSPDLFVAEYVCRPRHAGYNGEEQSARDEIVFIRRGLFLKHFGRATVTANPNHVIFFNRAETYRASHPADGGDDCVVFSLSRMLLDPILAAHDPAAADHSAPAFRWAYGPCPPELYLAHLALARRLAQRELCDLAADEAVVGLAAQALGQAHAVRGLRPPRGRMTTQAGHRDCVEAVKILLARHFREPLTLADVARQVHTSPFHLCRLFRRETGVSLHVYRTQLRLRAGLARLAEGAVDLTELALTLGFAHHSHFTNAFRRSFGFPPTMARRILSGGRWREMSKIMQVSA